MASIEILGVKATKKLLSSFPKEVKECVSREVNKTAIRIQASARENLTSNGNVDTGRLRSSVNIKSAGELAVDVGSDLPYAWALEFGSTGLGKKWFPPIEPIMKWVQRKGISKNPAEARSIAFAIARAISRRGYTARPFLRPAAIAHRKAFFEAVKKCGPEAGRLVAKAVRVTK